MSQFISVTLLTKNSQKHLAACLRALQRFPEIVVLDNGSTDNTMAIAGSFPNTRIETSPFIGFGPLKNLAAQHASYDWILSIDSDEVLSQELADELLALDLRDTRQVYSFLRHNYYGRKRIKACGWDNDYVERLYCKQTTKFADLAVHEHILVEGLRVQRLRHPLLHFTYDSISQLVEKANKYSSLFAEENRFRKSSSPAKSYFKWSFSFFRNYILQKGFLYGYEGLTISFTNAAYTFYKYMKLYEENQKLAISFILTSTEEAGKLGPVLESLLSQSEAPAEIIVVDAMHNRETQQVVAQTAASAPLPVRYCSPVADSSRRDALLTQAIAMATGEYLVLLENPIALAPDFTVKQKRSASKNSFVASSPGVVALWRDDAAMAVSDLQSDAAPPSGIPELVARLLHHNVRQKS